MVIPLVLVLILICLKSNQISGIKFSAESFAEISVLAEKGRTHLENLHEKANIPQFGSCWKNAISDLQIGCKFLSENVQSDLALRFTDCFLQMSGHEPLDCDKPKSVCLKKLSDRAFNAYTEFYTHTQSICYFLQSQVWQEETEKTIDKLSVASIQVSNKLKEAGEIQEKLLIQQKESLSLQHDLNNNSKKVATVLETSQDKIKVFMNDFKVTASEQKELLVELFENLVLFRSWAVNELSWFNSTVYFSVAILLCFFFTSVSRTREARIVLFIIFSFNYFFERLLSSASSNMAVSYFIGTPESFDSCIWLCRKFCVCLGIIILIYSAFSYCDYNLYNYKLLLEIKNQNSKIINHISLLNSSSSSDNSKHLKSSVKSLNNGCNNVLNDHIRGFYSSNGRVHFGSFTVMNTSYSTDEIDNENNTSVSNASSSYNRETNDKNNYDNKNDISIISETESPLKEVRRSYNLRSIKSRQSLI